MSLSRRDALKFSGAFVASTTLTGYTSVEKESIESFKAPLSDTKNPRVVVVGGGWSGLSVAKNVKLLTPKADVILVEQRDQFVSCPMSNLWLMDRVDLEVYHTRLS